MILCLRTRIENPVWVWGWGFVQLQSNWPNFPISLKIEKEWISKTNPLVPFVMRAALKYGCMVGPTPSPPGFKSIPQYRPSTYSIRPATA